MACSWSAEVLVATLSNVSGLAELLDNIKLTSKLTDAAIPRADTMSSPRLSQPIPVPEVIPGRRLEALT